MDSRLVLINFLGQAVELFFLLLIFYFSRLWFDLEIIGDFAILVTTTSIFSFIADFGVSIAHVNFYNKAVTPEEKSRCNGALLILKIIQLGIVSILLLFQVNFSPGLSEHKDLSIIFGVGIIMYQIFAQIATSVFQSQKKVVKIRFGRTLAFAIRFFSIVSFYFFSLIDPLLSLALSFLFQSVFFMGYSLFLLKNVPIKIPTRDLLINYVKYFFPFIFSTSSIFIIHQIPIVLLSNFNYPKEEIGIYSTAFQLYAWILLFPSLITQVLLPTLSKNTPDLSINIETEKKIIKTHKYITIISLFITIASFIFSEQLITNIFVGGYKSSGIILTILVLGKSYELASIAYVTDLQAKKLVYYSEMMYILNLIIFLITIYFFISPDFLNMGIYGAAYAWLLSSFVYWTIFDVVTCIKYKYKFYWGVIWLFLIFFAIIIIDYFFLRDFLSNMSFPLNIMIEGVICLSLFVGSLFIFKITDKNDFVLIKKILNPKKFMEEMKKQMES